MFVEGAKRAYAGHLTLKFTPDVTSTVPHHKHYCLEVGENCSPTVDRSEFLYKENQKTEIGIQTKQRYFCLKLTNCNER